MLVECDGGNSEAFKSIQDATMVCALVAALVALSKFKVLDKKMLDI